MTKIPNISTLCLLVCEDTLITELPNFTNLEIEFLSDDCCWLNPPDYKMY
jgi:hypothetical protein